MIFDKDSLFSDNQAITVTAPSTDHIDCGATPSEIAAYNEKGVLEVLAQVTTAFAGGTNLKVDIEQDDNTSFSSATVLRSSSVFLTAALIAGKDLNLGKLPIVTERYIRLNYTVVGTHTAGAIKAGLILDKHTNV